MEQIGIAIQMRYKLSSLITVKSLNRIMPSVNFLFSIISLIVMLLVGRSEARGCSNGVDKGDCFDTTIESCNTGLSVIADCKTKFGDNVCYSLVKADMHVYIVRMLRYRNVRWSWTELPALSRLNRSRTILRQIYFFIGNSFQISSVTVICAGVWKGVLLSQQGIQTPSHVIEECCPGNCAEQGHRTEGDFEET